MESLGKNRLIHRKITSITLALLLGAGGIATLPPTALAAAPSNGTVSSTRSFPATTTTRRDLTRESISTDVQSDTDQHRRAVGHGLGRYRNPERAADEIPNGKRRRSESPTGGGVPQTGSRAGGTTSPSASYPTGRSQQERGTNRHHSTSVQDRTGRSRICYAVQRIPIRVRRQPAIRLGLFRIRPIRVRAIRCQSPPPVRQSDERRFARGIIGGSPTG